MEDAVRIINSHINNGVPDDELLNVIQALKYMDPEHLQADYGDELTNSVYMVKYGAAYALEYAVMYDAVFNREKAAQYNHQKYISNIKPVTFGCGSFISTWSLGFIYADKSEHCNRFNFIAPDVDIGVDLARWPLSFDLSEYEGHIRQELKQMDITEYINEHWNDSVNLLAFTKILNELPAETVNSIINAIKRKAEEGCFSGDVYYLCISHSKNEYDGKRRVQEIAEKLIDAINVNDDFVVDDTIPSYFYKNFYENSGSSYNLSKLKEIDTSASTKCYCFNSNGQNTYLPVRALFGNAFKISKNIDNLTHQLQDYVETNQEDGEFRAIRSTSQVRLQVIRFTRKTGGNV
jgi:hypothetical protein